MKIEKLNLWKLIGYVHDKNNASISKPYEVNLVIQTDDMAEAWNEAKKFVKWYDTENEYYVLQARNMKLRTRGVYRLVENKSGTE